MAALPEGDVGPNCSILPMQVTAVRTNGVFVLGWAWLGGREVAVVQIGPKVLRTDTDETWHQVEADDLGVLASARLDSDWSSRWAI